MFRVVRLSSFSLVGRRFLSTKSAPSGDGWTELHTSIRFNALPEIPKWTAQRLGPYKCLWQGVDTDKYRLWLVDPTNIDEGWTGLTNAEEAYIIRRSGPMLWTVERQETKLRITFRNIKTKQVRVQITLTNQDDATFASEEVREELKHLGELLVPLSHAVYEASIRYLTKE